MTKKSFVVILILSVIVTYGVAWASFTFSISKGTAGLPFSFSRFNFLGAETNNTMLLLDIVFWFAVIWGVWKILQRAKAKK